MIHNILSGLVISGQDDLCVYVIVAVLMKTLFSEQLCSIITLIFFHYIFEIIKTMVEAHDVWGLRLIKKNCIVISIDIEMSHSIISNNS